MSDQKETSRCLGRWESAARSGVDVACKRISRLVFNAGEYETLVNDVLFIFDVDLIYLSGSPNPLRSARSMAWLRSST